MSEPGVDTLISVDDAVAIIDRVEVRPRVVEMRIDDPAILGMTLAQTVLSDRDYPPFDRALMDGYAVRSDDPGTNRRIAGEIAAGAEPDAPLQAGDAVAIMTGAPVPRGADAVVPIERVQKRSGSVEIPDGLRRGQNISPRGADCEQDAELAPTGTRITPAVLAVLATVGLATVRVHDRPWVGVLSTGNEIIPFDQTPNGPQIRNSNNLLLRALIPRYGCRATDLGHVRDEPATIRQAIANASADVLLVTGGMSMGEYDFVPSVLQSLDYALPITKLKIKPGKPFVMAIRKGPGTAPRIVFGLPGNPVSGYVCTVRLVSRLLLRMGGGSTEPRWTPAILTHDLPANGAREFYQPCDVSSGRATVFSWKGSADLFTLAKANALAVRPAGDGPKRVGDSINTLEVPQ